MGSNLVTVTLKESASTDLLEKANRLSPAKINAGVGRAVSSLVRSHMQAYGKAHPNKLGGKRTNLIGKAADSVMFTSDDTGATIGASQQGLRQRLLGGPISPKNGKYLVWPVVKEAYGKSPREYPNLFVIFGKGKKPIGLGTRPTLKGSFVLRDGLAVFKRKKGQKAKPAKMLFFMTKETVNQQGDRTILPEPSQVVNVAVEEIKRQIGAFSL